MLVMDDQELKKSLRNYMKSLWLILLRCCLLPYYFFAIILKEIRALFRSLPHFRIYMYSMKSWKFIYVKEWVPHRHCLGRMR